MSDLISRQDVLAYPIRADHYDREHGNKHFIAGIESVMEYVECLPSAEPKTPSNGSITSINSENTHDRTMGDSISRQDAIRWIKAECNPYGKPTLDYETSCRIMEHLDRMPSAEKTQLSGEDVTSVCKCPCVYREPCDYCHYDDYREHGCPAEEGMKDG